VLQILQFNLRLKKEKKSNKKNTPPPNNFTEKNSLRKNYFTVVGFLMHLMLCSTVLLADC